MINYQCLENIYYINIKSTYLKHYKIRTFLYITMHCFII